MNQVSIPTTTDVTQARQYCSDVHGCTVLLSMLIYQRPSMSLEGIPIQKEKVGKMTF